MNSENSYIIQNRHFFTNLNEFEISWILLEDGQALVSGTLPELNIAPQTKKTIFIQEVSEVPIDPAREYFINFQATTKEASELIPKGHIIASEQILLSKPEYSAAKIPKGNVKVRESDGLITISGTDFTATFDKSQSRLTSYRLQENELIKESPYPNFWRALTDNDYGNNFGVISGIYKDADQKSWTTDFRLEQNKESTDLIFDVLFSSLSSEGQITYQVYPDGTIKVHYKIEMDKGMPEIPRIGMKLQMPVTYDQVSWYGRGPHENYWDRQASSFVGLYEARVADLYTPYIRPQENGNRTDTRWVSFTNEQGLGLKFEGLPYFDFTAHHNTISDFDYDKNKINRHTSDIDKKDLVEICIDHRQRGVGGDNSWGALPHDEYRLFPGVYSLQFRMTPVKPGKN